MGAGKDEDRLIGIRKQHLLVISLRARVQPDDGAPAFLHLVDHTAAIRQDSDPYSISNGGDIAPGPALFQLTAQLANDKALIGLYGKETRLGFDNETVK
jgi:hypothetical protein